MFNVVFMWVCVCVCLCVTLLVLLGLLQLLILLDVVDECEEVMQVNDQGLCLLGREGGRDVKEEEHTLSSSSRRHTRCSHTLTSPSQLHSAANI